MGYYKTKTAVVEKGASVGKGTRIWHFSHIMKGARVGANCTIGQNVFIGKGVRIGNNVKVQNNVSVYSGVTLEDGVFCGPSVVFTNVKKPRSLYPVNGKYDRTLIRREAAIGANATVVCGTVIGTRAFVGAGSVVTRDVPDYALVYGNPARPAGWICGCGEKITFRKGNRKALCSRCRLKYIGVENGIRQE